MHELRSAIAPQDGESLAHLIRSHPHVSQTLEIGCAHGLSSLFICSAIQDRRKAFHTIIDPSQHTVWDGVGIRNLEECGIEFFRLLEEGSEFALPKLLESEKNEFDLIFIDGWHTFDHTMVDCFYATRLLRINGFIVLDDADWPSVKRVYQYFSNYPCYEPYEIARECIRTPATSTHEHQASGNSARLQVLQKVADDSRNWKWHDDNF